MSKALKAAVKAGADRMGDLAVPFDADDARAIITAFLDAAAEDEGTADGVWTCAYDTWAEFGATDRDAGKAAILALKEAVNG